MKKTVLTAFVTLILLIAVIPGTAHGWNGIRKISPSETAINQYETFELDVSLDAPHENPYDPEQIDLSALITTPDKKTITLPAFFTGKRPAWKIRYTPAMTGKYSYSLRLKTPSDTYTSPVHHFEVKAGPGNGFLRKSRNNAFYLAFDSGRPFFGIGHNTGWVVNNNIAVYEKYFSDLRDHGCNLTRIWINNPWTLSIENRKIGDYNLSDCDKLDSVIRLAEEYGIYIILVLDSYGSLMEDTGAWNEGVWGKNPYNSVNGGPCEQPWDFFTNPEARTWYRNRLRYIVSRWSHSPGILAFELWNEVDTPRDWAAEMLGYLKSINPHGQLVTTSLSYPWGNNFDESTIWSLKDLDLIEQHIWGDQARDIIGYLIATNRAVMEKNNKPLFVGEFGMNTRLNDKLCDRSGHGTALHNSIWASALSGSFSGALNWWWAGYVRGKNLYPHYRALRNFVADVNWDSKRVAFPETTPIMRKVPESEEIICTDTTVQTKKTWGDTRYREFTINNNGDVSGGVINYYLQGLAQKGLKINPIFHLNYPESGKFIIHVDMVSQGACVIGFLDTARVMTAAFPTGPGSGPWKKSIHIRTHDIYQCYYNTTIEVAVPRGEHTLKLINTGKDWLGIKKITLTGYKNNAFVNARLTGLIIGDEILFWIQNKDYNWHRATRGMEPSQITGASFDVRNTENGRYEVEWWDTFNGDIILRESAHARDNMLRISIPAFSKDLACKIRKKDGSPGTLQISPATGLKQKARL